MNSPSTTHDSQPTKKGWIATYYRHYKGKRLGPYYVRRWKQGGKVHKEYIKAENVERVRNECDAHRRERIRKQVAGRREVTFLKNFIFNSKMYFRLEQNKPIAPVHADWIVRLHQDGMYTEGRPPMRRRIVRSYALINGEERIVTTVYELDGTTRVFMVPLFTNQYFKRLKQEVLSAWHTLVGPKTTTAMTT